MNTLDRKKLNLLVHLARIDGRFEKTERELLQVFLKTKKLESGDLDADYQPVRFGDFADAPGKMELMYWALNLVQADQVLHEKELLFCRHMAMKLNFREGIVAKYVNSPLPDAATFEEEVKNFWLA